VSTPFRARRLRSSSTLRCCAAFTGRRGFMFHKKPQVVVCALAVAAALALANRTAHADRDDDDQGGGGQNKVFVIAMENHNWTQPNPTSSPQQIFMNPAAPFINSLVNGTSGISKQVAYANNYQGVLDPDHNNQGLHPSEPNYVWAESGQ